MQFQPFLKILSALLQKEFLHLKEKTKQVKKQLVQEALGSYEKTITQTQKEINCSTKDLIAVTETGTQNSVKTKLVRTQDRKEDFEGEFQDIDKKKVLIVKVSR